MLDKLKNKKIGVSTYAGIVLVLVLICAFVLFSELNNYRNIRSEKHKFYYYFINNKIDFEADIVLGTDDLIMSMNANNVSLDSTPIYYDTAEEKMILPENMEIVYPYKNVPMYKLGKFSQLYYIKQYIYIQSEAGTGRLYDCFLYDGNDLYVFPEEVTILIDDVSYKLSSMSYVKVTKNNVSIYDKKKDEHIVLDDYTKAEAYTEEYFINLIGDSFTYNNSYYILMKNIEGLDFYKFN